MQVKMLHSAKPDDDQDRLIAANGLFKDMNIDVPTTIEHHPAKSNHVKGSRDKSVALEVRLLLRENDFDVALIQGPLIGGGWIEGSEENRFHNQLALKQLGNQRKKSVSLWLYY